MYSVSASKPHDEEDKKSERSCVSKVLRWTLFSICLFVIINIFSVYRFKVRPKWATKLRTEELRQDTTTVPGMQWTEVIPQLVDTNDNTKPKEYWKKTYKEICNDRNAMVNWRKCSTIKTNDTLLYKVNIKMAPDQMVTLYCPKTFSLMSMWWGLKNAGYDQVEGRLVLPYKFGFVLSTDMTALKDQTWTNSIIKNLLWE